MRGASNANERVEARDRMMNIRTWRRAGAGEKEAAIACCDGRVRFLRPVEGRPQDSRESACLGGCERRRRHRYDCNGEDSCPFFEDKFRSPNLGSTAPRAYRPIAFYRGKNATSLEHDRTRYNPHSPHSPSRLSHETQHDHEHDTSPLSLSAPFTLHSVAHTHTSHNLSTTSHVKASSFNPSPLVYTR